MLENSWVVFLKAMEYKPDFLKTLGKITSFTVGVLEAEKSCSTSLLAKERG